MTKAFVFLNGEFTKNLKFYEELKIDEKHLYCADGGAKQALELKYTPREVWGDFDSLSDECIDILKKKGVKLKKFNKDKDFSDGEILIKYVVSLGYNKIYILGGTGGRIDHFLTNINLSFKYPNIIFKTEKEEIFVIEKKYEFDNLKGVTLSFIPFSDNVKGIDLKGVKYPLKNYTLKRGDSICLSNIITENKAMIKFLEGKIIAILTFN